jgi:UrcA family protein
MLRNRLTMVAAGLAGLAGLAGWLVASTAIAGDTAAVRRVHVKYASADLHSSAGVDRLYVRLQQAANSACEYAMVRGQVDRACAARALDAAVADVGSAELAALHTRTATASRPATAG